MLRICLSGHMRVAVDGEEVPAPSRQDACRLLAYLILHHGSRLARDAVAFDLWPDVGEATARASFRRALHRLQQYLGGLDAGVTWLEHDRRFIRWAPGDRVSIDVVEFEAACTICDDLAPDTPAPEVAACLEGTVGHYRDDLLVDATDPWVVEARQRLNDRRTAALSRLADLYEQRGDYAAALACARRQVAHDDLAEVIHRRLMRLYALTGDRAAALRQFDRCRERLREALGAEPMPETLRLRQIVVEGRPLAEMSRGRPPDVAPVRMPALTTTPRVSNLPVAHNRFIGRGRAIDTIRGLLATTPVLTLVGPGGMGKTRLAVEAARSMAGAYPQGAWLIDLSAVGDPTLVPAAAAAALDVYTPPDRLPLDALRDHLAPARSLLVVDNCEHVLDAAAQLVAAIADTCPEVRILATSREHLRLDQEVVWAVPALDLPDAAAVPDHDAILRGEAVALFLDRAQRARYDFAASPGDVRDIATICQRLDGMPLAIELAAARVRVLSVGEIATRLGHRLSVLGEGSRSGPARHRTIRATVDWSYELLDDTERTVFRRLAIFAGGFTLDALEAVCVEDDAQPAARAGNGLVLDTLARLVEKSLVEALALEDGTSRYRLLGLMREYGQEKLAAAGERETIARRHTRECLHLAEAAAVGLRGPERRRWFARLESERHNLHEAMVRLSERGPEVVEDALRLGAALWQYWYLRGNVDWERQWLETILSRSADTAPSLEAAVRHAAGGLAYAQGDLAAARAHYERAVSLRRGRADERQLAASLDHLAVVCTALDDLAAAATACRESLALREEAGDVPAVIDTLNILANIEVTAGRYERAHRLLSRSIRAHHDSGAPDEKLITTLRNLGVVAQRLGRLTEARTWLEQGLALEATHLSRRDQAMLQNELGLVGYWQGKLDEAQRMLRESLDGYREVGDRQATCVVLCNLARVALARGDPATSRLLAREARDLAVEYGGEGERLFSAGCLLTTLIEAGDVADDALVTEVADIAERTVEPDTRAWSHHLLGRVALQRRDVARAASHLASALADQAELQLPCEVARTLESCAALALARHDPALALRLLGASDRLRETTGAARAPLEAGEAEHILRSARDRLDVAAAEAGLAKGHSWSMTDAVVAVESAFGHDAAIAKE